jgi:molybdenum cofactor guanylyltransferase
MSKTYGLVVCGGKSTRMGTDKSLLNYHGLPQRYYLYHMLEELCEKVFISCNAEQAKTIPDNYAVFVDAPEYAEIGPMAALLTAFKHEPDASFLVIGCDYPLVSKELLQALLKAKNQSIFCCALARNGSNIIEPLIAHYHNNIESYLLKKFRQNNYSIQSVLRTINTHIIYPENDIEISSIDTVADYERIKKQL